MSDQLTQLANEDGSALYEVNDPSQQKSKVRKCIVSTPESRLICNDPCLAGVEYTHVLQKSCATALRLLQKENIFTSQERNSIVLHVLRGGLNFGLREALYDAFSWNRHNAAFVSAQRARKSLGSHDWIITENEYCKLSLRPKSSIIFGDVVATGTSLNYALHSLAQATKDQEAEITDITFFTIGGSRSHEILEALEEEALNAFPNYQGSTVVYLEGIFAVATDDSPLRIKIDGTDLLRRDGIIAPEFIESQYEKPSYPLERCTIYDAGSRAFEGEEYFSDVQEYWQQVSELADQGVTFTELLQERTPELDASRFPEVNLKELCQKHLEQLS